MYIEFLSQYRVLELTIFRSRSDHHRVRKKLESLRAIHVSRQFHYSRVTSSPVDTSVIRVTAILLHTTTLSRSIQVPRMAVTSYFVRTLGKVNAFVRRWSHCVDFSIECYRLRVENELRYENESTYWYFEVINYLKKNKNKNNSMKTCRVKSLKNYSNETSLYSPCTMLQDGLETGKVLNRSRKFRESPKDLPCSGSYESRRALNKSFLVRR